MISQTLKTNRLYSALCVIFALFFSNCTTAQNNKNMSDKQNKYYSTTDTSKVTINNEEWKKNLDPEVYTIARNKGTERAFTGQYWNHYDAGLYRCKACGNALFKSDGEV